MDIRQFINRKSFLIAEV